MHTCTTCMISYEQPAKKNISGEKVHVILKIANKLQINFHLKSLYMLMLLLKVHVISDKHDIICNKNYC